jgi:hypothetical protein
VSATALAAANAAPADRASTATGGQGRKRAVRASGARPTRSRVRQNEGARGRGTTQSANGPTPPSIHSSHSGRRASRGRAERARGKAVGHREAGVSSPPGESPVPLSAPPGSPSGHANGHGDHAKPPGADRGRGRDR